MEEHPGVPVHALDEAEAVADGSDHALQGEDPASVSVIVCVRHNIFFYSSIYNFSLKNVFENFFFPIKTTKDSRIIPFPNREQFSLLRLSATKKCKSNSGSYIVVYIHSIVATFRVLMAKER